MKKKKAFSMIELVVSFIAAALIMGITTPIFFKKNSSIKLTSLNKILNASRCNVATDIAPKKCTLCFKGANGVHKCLVCTRNCTVTQYQNKEECACHNCSEHSTNCVRCNYQFCTKCNERGFYLDKTVPAPHICRDCPLGQYCNGTSTKFDCPFDTYRDVVRGYIKNEHCFSCPSNSTTQGRAGNTDIYQCLCKEGFGRINRTTCEACFEDFYKPGVNNNKCAQCPINSTTGKRQSTVKTECYCKSRYYGNVGSACLGCNPGYYCPGGPGNALQKQCPLNSTSPALSYRIEDCICNKGYYRVGNTCYPCGKGYYCPDGVNRKNCGKGNYCPGETEFAPTPCSAGHYCPGANETKNNPCGKGYYCPDVVTKKDCGKGYYCPTDTLVNHKDCAKNFYCPGENEKTQTPCPNGMTSPKNSVKKSQCKCADDEYKVGDNCKKCSEFGKCCIRCNKDDECTKIKDGNYKLYDGYCYRHPKDQADCTSAFGERTDAWNNKEPKRIFAKDSDGLGACIGSTNSYETDTEYTLNSPNLSCNKLDTACLSCWRSDWDVKPKNVPQEKWQNLSTGEGNGFCTTSPLWTNYSACSRQVCTYVNVEYVCTKDLDRLPRQSELDYILSKSKPTSNKFGANPAHFCMNATGPVDASTYKSVWGYCPDGIDKCNGSAENKCHQSYMLLSGKKNAWYIDENKKAHITPISDKTAGSIRCSTSWVKDK